MHANLIIILYSVVLYAQKHNLLTKIETYAFGQQNTKYISNYTKFNLKLFWYTVNR